MQNSLPDHCVMLHFIQKLVYWI